MLLPILDIESLYIQATVFTFIEKNKEQNVQGMYKRIINTHYYKT